MLSCYRLQRSWAKVMFLQVCVILFTGGGCLPRCMLGYHPPGADPPPRSRHPPRADTPQSRYPPKTRPPRSRHLPLGTDTPPRPDLPGADNPPKTRHPEGSRLRHTVNERPVRILLECILVYIYLLTTGSCDQSLKFKASGQKAVVKFLVSLHIFCFVCLFWILSCQLNWLW